MGVTQPVHFVGKVRWANSMLKTQQHITLLAKLGEESLELLWYEVDNLPENIEGMFEDHESHEESDDSNIENDI